MGIARLVAVLVVVLVAAGSATAAQTAKRPLTYIALGDSIASGHGLGDSGGLCRRSVRAYPQKVRAALEVNYGPLRFRQLACSGATTTDLHAQVSAALAAIGTRRALVTLTIGINDFDWSNIPLTYLRLRDPDEADFESWVDGIAKRAGKTVGVEIGRLLARRGVAVVLTDYPDPVNPQSLLFGGPQPCPDVSACYARAEYLVHTLDAQLAKAVASRPRARLASVEKEFKGHEAPSPECGSAPPSVADTWFQYPSDPGSNSFPQLPPSLPQGWRGDCFHPNDAGATSLANAVFTAAKELGR